MNKLSKFLWVLISFVLIVSNVSAYTSSSTSWGYNTPIIDWSIEFKAELSDWKVYTSWTTYDKDESFKYYKVVRSNTNDNPVYPDDGYIAYYTDVNKLAYIDNSPLVWISFYRVCAITNESNRYCSNVVKIYNEESDSTWIACTADAKKCPDWSYVWRTWPNCEFAACPVTTVCTMEYAPVCWQPPMPKCSAEEACAQVMPAPKTYSNKCMMEADWATLLYGWECENNNLVWNDRDEHGCIASAWYTWCEAKQKCLRLWEETCEEAIVCTMEWAPVCWKINWEYKTYGNKCMLNASGASYMYTWECSRLSYTLRYKADKLVNSFILALEAKYSWASDRVEILTKLIGKLEELASSNPKLSSLIDYIVIKLKDNLESYDDWFWEIENIFNQVVE